MQHGTFSRDDLFLGLDSSTQSLKAILINSRFEAVYEAAVNFDRDLPDFKTQGGVHRGPDGLTVTSPPLLWVAALDLLLGRMRADGVAFARIRAVSGSGQQHGSVFLRRGTEAVLRALRPEQDLRSQLAEVFAVSASPIWMDSSTTRQCRRLEAGLGGAQKVAELTGSRAYERFTGNQIAKIHETNPAGYEATERISLVSSFMASLLAGKYAPIDVSDGSGMNLMDVRTRAWAPAALELTAPGLAAKLGPLVASHTVIGTLQDYFCRRYGFAADCQVVAFSGDNPNSLAGLRLQEDGDVAISLGTSDTIFASLSVPAPSADEGHIFASLVEPKAYMGMVCYKNGSLTREAIRDSAAAGSWSAFNESLRRTAAGNGGNVGFYIKEPEITPPILKTGFFRFDAAGRRVETFAPDVDVRAVVEGQFLSMRLHCGNIGIRPRKVLCTGGASTNAEIVRVIANVLGVPVLTGEQPNSAALGAAYRAMHGLLCSQRGEFVPFKEATAGAPEFKKAADPEPVAHGVYSGMLARYAELEKRVLTGG